jgi:hypothetical protein
MIHFTVPLILLLLVFLLVQGSTKMDRTPSFAQYTTRTIVNLSGLSVADPLPQRQGVPSDGSLSARSNGSHGSRSSFHEHYRGPSGHSSHAMYDGDYDASSPQDDNTHYVRKSSSRNMTHSSGIFMDDDAPGTRNNTTTMQEPGAQLSQSRISSAASAMAGAGSSLGSGSGSGLGLESGTAGSGTASGAGSGSDSHKSIGQVPGIHKYVALIAHLGAAFYLRSDPPVLLFFPCVSFVLRLFVSFLIFFIFLLSFSVLFSYRLRLFPLYCCRTTSMANFYYKRSMSGEFEEQE